MSKLTLRQIGTSQGWLPRQEGWRVWDLAPAPSPLFIAAGDRQPDGADLVLAERAEDAARQWIAAHPEAELEPTHCNEPVLVVAVEPVSGLGAPLGPFIQFEARRESEQVRPSSPQTWYFYECDCGVLLDLRRDQAFANQPAPKCPDCGDDVVFKGYATADTMGYGSRGDPQEITAPPTTP